MIDSKHEEKARQETEAGSTREETCALQRGAKKSVGSGEEVTQEMIEAGLWHFFRYSPDDSTITAEEIVGEIYKAMSGIARGFGRD